MPKNPKSDEKPVGRKRIQFSISTYPEIKEKLESLAAINRMTLSEFMEKLALDAIAGVDPQTWNMIRTLEEKAAMFKGERRRGRRGSDSSGSE